MSEHGGLFGTEEIDWFNGGLFDTGDVIPLTGTEITTLLDVSKLNWALIGPWVYTMEASCRVGVAKHQSGASGERRWSSGI
jgi:hypothetical protein